MYVIFFCTSPSHQKHENNITTYPVDIILTTRTNVPVFQQSNPPPRLRHQHELNPAQLGLFPACFLVFLAHFAYFALRIFRIKFHIVRRSLTSIGAYFADFLLHYGRYTQREYFSIFTRLRGTRLTQPNPTSLPTPPPLRQPKTQK